MFVKDAVESALGYIWYSVQGCILQNTKYPCCTDFQARYDYTQKELLIGTDAQRTETRPF